MTPVVRRAVGALAREIRLATLSLKLDVLVTLLEKRYRPDQPRAPKGTREGGQWIDDLGPNTGQDSEHVLVAGPRCDGFSSGCQLGGSYGTTGMLKISGKNLCRQCAIKFLGIQGLPSLELEETLRLFDPTIR